jgi:putative peptide zinc metalloprotease protein
MKVPHLQLTARTGAIALVAAAVIGVGGWAFADGGIPLVSSPTAATSTTASSTSAGSGANTDNVAAAANTHDGKTVFAISLKIVQTGASTVDPVNAAVAVASCTDCQTVAIALEGVLVYGSPTTFDPTNIALAINTSCNNCQTLATAYQDVVQNGTRVRISGAGRQQIAAIRKDLESLRNSGLDILAIQQRVNDDAGKFLQVLQNDVLPIGPPAQAGRSSTSTTSSATASTSTTAPAATSTTSSPAASTTTPPS